MPFCISLSRTLLCGTEPSASRVCSSSTEELTEVCTKPRGGRLQERSGFLTATHLSPTPAPLELDVPRFCSTPEQAALLTAPTQHPASHTPCFCSRTFQNSPASISCLLSLVQLSGLSVPKSSLPKMLGLFLPEPCGTDKTWPHLSPAAQMSPT